VNRKRRSIRALWKTALCVGLLGIAFHGIFLQETRRAGGFTEAAWSRMGRAEQWRAAWASGPRLVWERVRNASPLEGLASVACVGLILLVQAARWHRLLGAQGVPLSWGRTLEITLVAQFFNSFLLGTAGGDLMKAYYAARETRRLKTESVTTVLVDRMIGLLAMLCVSAAMAAVNLRLLLSAPRLRWVTAAALGMFLAAAALTLALLRQGVTPFSDWFRKRLERSGPGRTLLRSLSAARLYGGRPRLLAAVWALSLLIVLGCVVQVWLVARSLGVSHVPFTVWLWVAPTVICIAALPITPSGLGVRENLYVWILTAPGIGVAGATALSISLIAFLGMLFWSVVGAAVYVGFRKRHRLAEVAQEAAE